jgi:hypothetical protein
MLNSDHAEVAPGYLKSRSFVEGLRRSQTNMPTGTRDSREPSLESTSEATLLLRGMC